MKIYFIDKLGKYINIKNNLEELLNEKIEIKENVKHRINKTDVVITVDFENEYENYKKINNLVILTNKKDKKEIWNMANKLNTKDIIFIENSEEYISKRIEKILK